MKVLGKITVDPVGRELETGYMRFDSPLGLDGLVMVRSPRLDILFVGSSRPGTGQFRRFITQAKTEFDTICIWQICNGLLHSILPRYGFKPAADYYAGEQMLGYRWDKSAN